MPTRKILDAPRALQRRRENALKLKVLRMHIKAGVEALERGDFTEVDDGELDTWRDACQALD
jgi:antitoxin ParD1/3/4